MNILKKISPTAFKSGMKLTGAWSVRGPRFLPPGLSERIQSWILIGNITQTKTAGGSMLLASALGKWEATEVGIRPPAHRGLRLRPGGNVEGVLKMNIERPITPWRGWMGKDEETQLVIQGLTSDSWKQMKLDCGAQRHHYSMFNVGRSMLGVHLKRYAWFRYISL